MPSLIRLCVTLCYFLFNGHFWLTNGQSSDDEMDVSNDDEDSGEEEIIPQMGTIASLEEILRTLVITLQEELPRFRDIMVELVDKLQSGRHQAAK